MCVPSVCLMNFRALLSLRDLEQFCGLLLRGGKAIYLSDHVLYELGVVGEAPMTVTVLQLAHIIVHLVALVEAHGSGVAQSHGCCSMAAAVEVLITFLYTIK